MCVLLIILIKKLHLYDFFFIFELYKLKRKELEPNDSFDIIQVVEDSINLIQQVINKWKNILKSKLLWYYKFLILLILKIYVVL